LVEKSFLFNIEAELCTFLGAAVKELHECTCLHGSTQVAVCTVVAVSKLWKGFDHLGEELFALLVENFTERWH
jgi:hypothetical protein